MKWMGLERRAHNLYCGAVVATRVHILWWIDVDAASIELDPAWTRRIGNAAEGRAATHTTWPFKMELAARHCQHVCRADEYCETDSDDARWCRREASFGHGGGSVFQCSGRA